MKKHLITALIMGALFFTSIYVLATEFEHLSLVHQSGRLLVYLFVPALILTYFAYRYLQKDIAGLELWRFVIMAFIFFLLVSEAFGIYLNRLTSTRCEPVYVTVLARNPQFVSAYGKISGEVAANSWEMVLGFADDSSETYVLKSRPDEELANGSNARAVFCKSLFGFKTLQSLSADDRE